MAIGRRYNPKDRRTVRPADGKDSRGGDLPRQYSPPRDNPPPTCEELLRIADEMGGRDMMRFAR